MLEGELAHTAQPVEIREVLTEDDWQAYRDLDMLWWLESGTGEYALGPYSVEHHDEHMLNRRVKAPHVRGWFARVDGEPRAFLSSWPGENGVGVVEDLFCHPEYRHRGLATALIAHCVADVRAGGAGPVIINADPKETPKHMYAAMGSGRTTFRGLSGRTSPAANGSGVSQTGELVGLEELAPFGLLTGFDAAATDKRVPEQVVVNVGGRVAPGDNGGTQQGLLHEV